MNNFYHPKISKIIIDSAFKVHTKLGPGLLEKTYEIALTHEIQKAGLKVLRQKSLPLIYDDLEIQDAYRLDLLVENKVIVEIKSVETLHNVHFKQLLTYLKVSKMKVGYLINFNVDRLKGNFHRKVY